MFSLFEAPVAGAAPAESVVLSAKVKTAPSISAAARVLSGLGLFWVGGVGFIFGLVVFFGWLMKDTKSAPDPTLRQILISVGLGSVILVSSIACLVLAGRLLKRKQQAELPNDNVR